MSDRWFAEGFVHLLWTGAATGGLIYGASSLGGTTAALCAVGAGVTFALLCMVVATLVAAR